MRQIPPYPIRIREIEGAGILDTLNCAAIAAQYFHRSRAWLTQRLNNNTVNGRPVSFTPAELLTLRQALRSVAHDITTFTTRIPNQPTDMATKVYVITDRNLIEALQSDDLDAFKACLAEDEYLYFGEPEQFDTEAEALAFCAGLGHGTDERATPDRYPLRSSEPADLPYIEAIESY